MSHYPGAQFLFSAAAAAQFPPDQGAEVAIAGRSNAGKSSAINAITERRALARTSKTPGRTRLVNFFELAAGRRLIDLPGYGFAAGPPAERDDWAVLIEALARRRALRGMLVVVDARRGLLAADAQLINWAEGLERPLHLLLSKADQLSKAEARARLADTQSRLGERASVQLFSAHQHVGLDEVRDVVDGWLK